MLQNHDEDIDDEALDSTYVSVLNHDVTNNNYLNLDRIHDTETVSLQSKHDTVVAYVENVDN